jgi:hypothetical protein
MAVIADATTLVSLDDLVIAEFINTESGISLGRAPRVYQLGVFVVPLLGTNSNVYTNPLRNEVSEATVKIETDESDVVEITTDEASISTQMVTLAAFVSDEAQGDALWDAMAAAAEEVTWACARKINSDFLALLSGFSAPIGDAATTFTVENWVVMQTAWTARVESVSVDPLLVLHPDARRDLQLDAVNNAAPWFGASAGMQFHDSVKGINNGRVTSFDGINMVTASGVPVGDTTGWSNALIVPSGRNAAIAMPVLQGIQLEFQREPLRKGGYVVASVRYGVGKQDDDAGLTVISKT